MAKSPLQYANLLHVETVGILENGVLLMYTLAVLQTSLLLVKSLNKIKIKND